MPLNPLYPTEFRLASRDFKSQIQENQYVESVKSNLQKAQGTTDPSKEDYDIHLLLCWAY